MLRSSYMFLRRNPLWRQVWNFCISLLSLERQQSTRHLRKKSHPSSILGSSLTCRTLFLPSFNPKHAGGGLVLDAVRVVGFERQD